MQMQYEERLNAKCDERQLDDEADEICRTDARLTSSLRAQLTKAKSYRLFPTKASEQDMFQKLCEAEDRSVSITQHPEYYPDKPIRGDSDSSNSVNLTKRIDILKDCLQYLQHLNEDYEAYGKGHSTLYYVVLCLLVLSVAAVLYNMTVLYQGSVLVHCAMC